MGLISCAAVILSSRKAEHSQKILNKQHDNIFLIVLPLLID